MGFWKRLFAGGARSEPSAVSDKARQDNALRKKSGTDTSRFDPLEMAVMVGALEKGYKPKEIARALSEGKPEDVGRKFGLFE
jgi:hypothetical protein